MDKQSFIDIIKEGAIKAQNQFGICASLTLAQAILESGWGKSSPGNNLFGIKWTSGCGYEPQTLTTKECYDGVWRTINAQFRSYNSLADSIYDHAKFIINNSRYENLLGVRDYKTACKLIQQDGYATDPNYANQLIQIIEENRLYQYDNAKEEIKVKNIVVYGNSIDKRAAEYLADYLKCATLDGNIDYDYSNIENVYCVGGAPTLPWTGYAKKIIAGTDRFETIKEVLKFIGRL